MLIATGGFTLVALLFSYSLSPITVQRIDVATMIIVKRRYLPIKGNTILVDGIISV